MTAPRKPVAWISGASLDRINRLPALNRTAQSVMVSGDKAGQRTVPLYTAPNLQPLWELVEKWEKEAQTFADAGGDIALAEAAVFSNLSRELRTTLETL